MQIVKRRGDSRARRFGLLGLVFLTLSFAGSNAPLEASIGVGLTVDPASPAAVGTMITFTPELNGFASTDLWYRFRVREEEGVFRIIRDYGPERTFQWTSLDEGRYQVEVSVRERTTGEVATALTTIELTSRVSGEQAVIAPTANPLVYLYSARCDRGRARVRFAKDGDAPQFTPWKECSAGHSVNFYLAGLTAATSYSAVLESGAPAASADVSMSFTTSDVAWGQALPHPVVSGPSAREGVLLQATLNARAFATDMEGRLLWYGPENVSYVTNPAPGGSFWGLATSQVDPAFDVVREFDLAGTTVRETNAARVNEQLDMLGMHRITGFHHEARPLAGDLVAVLAAEERLLTDVQGAGTVDVLGDMIIVLDANMQVVWAWDSFDHLDTARVAILGETCAVAVGCAQHYLSADANDWTHGNSVARTSDGNLLYSARHQDWVVKIEYADGAGSGRILWRLGAGGDFSYASSDPYPWFSHQHDAHPATDEGSTIVLFDNGNTRVARGLGQTSRGQAIDLDEENMVATLRLNADLGVLSGALGSAQKLGGGDYQFNAGLVFDRKMMAFGAFSMETDRSGSVVSSLTVPYPIYRSFRMESLYGAQPHPRPRAIARP